VSRILFWNIANFGIDKIADPCADPITRELTYAQAAIQRYVIIQRVIQVTAPDIFVIVELNSNQAATPQLATGSTGIQGAETLLRWLRGQDASWRLVPPLKVGTSTKTEAVAVFYRGETGDTLRYFTGPNYWTGGPNGFSCLPEFAPGAAPYDFGEINSMLVPPLTEARPVPPAAAYCGGQMENTLAPRVLFREAGNPYAALDYGIYRPPYMATFTEVTGQEVRNLTVFGVHTPPKMKAPDSYPRGYPAYLASTEDVIGPFQDQETRVIGGDFNLPLFNGNGTQTDSYDPLIFHGYTLLLAPLDPTQPLNFAQRGYFGTSLRMPGTAGLWMYNYPGYDYFAQSYDNILIRRFDGAPTDRGVVTVMNTIVGTPYYGGQTNPINPPEMESLMRAPNMDWPQLQLDTTPEQATNLSSWNNFGCLRSTSDHLGVFADV
jgi:hypothetical protein